MSKIKTLLVCCLGLSLVLAFRLTVTSTIATAETFTPLGSEVLHGQPLPEIALKMLPIWELLLW
jgi:hypothetical protein